MYCLPSVQHVIDFLKKKMCIFIFKHKNIATLTTSPFPNDTSPSTQTSKHLKTSKASASVEISLNRASVAGVELNTSHIH